MFLVSLVYKRFSCLVDATFSLFSAVAVLRRLAWLIGCVLVTVQCLVGGCYKRFAVLLDELQGSGQVSGRCGVSKFAVKVLSGGGTLFLVVCVLGSGFSIETVASVFATVSIVMVGN